MSKFDPKVKPVLRYFWRGKGYPSIKAAAMAEAKAELKNRAYSGASKLRREDLDMPEIDCIAVDISGYLHTFYEQMFPRHADISGLSQVNGISHEPAGSDRFCNACRWAWIKARAAELVESWGADQQPTQEERRC